MPRPTGLFDSFDNLDQISPEAIAYWLKPVPALVKLENYLANKILYPQTIPLTESDMKIDSSILREALKMGDNPFLNVTLRKILIPEKFLQYVPDLINLVWVFIDALLLGRKKKDFFGDLWSIVLTDDNDEIIGSVLLPQFKGSNGEVILTITGKNYQIRQGSLMVIPCPKDRCEISYKIKRGSILGKSENAVEVYGGKLGLVVDGRNA